MNILFMTREEKDIELHVPNGKFKALGRVGEDTLSWFQGYVGGYVEVVSLGAMTGNHEFDDIDLVLHEEGKVHGLQPSLVFLTKENRVVDYIAGNAILCTTDDDGRWVGLDEDTIERLSNAMFIGQTTNGKMAVMRHMQEQTTP